MTYQRQTGFGKWCAGRADGSLLGWQGQSEAQLRLGPLRLGLCRHDGDADRS